MKNIHVLPTDKPSQLFHYIERPDKFFLDLKRERIPVSTVTHKNIYITSDEEIKAKDYILIIRKGLLIGELGEIVLIESTREGRTDYVRMDGTRGWFASDVNYQKDWNYKKIILTTDEDLIKDGIQAIDDEFLEWFVENPSCEFVNVKLKWHESKYNTNLGYTTYEIIILKEEPKQETLEEIAKDFIENTMKFSFNSLETRTQANRMLKCFEFGVKQQAKRMDNKEDLYKAFEAGHDSARLKGSYKSNGTFEEDFYEWFEQFKKK